VCVCVCVCHGVIPSGGSVNFIGNDVGGRTVNAQQQQQQQQQHTHIYIYIFLLWSNTAHGLLFLEVSTSYTTTQRSRYDSSGPVISLPQRPLPDNTQHSQQTDIHAPGRIRIHNLRGRAVADLRLRPPVYATLIIRRWLSVSSAFCVFTYCGSPLKTR